jgi:RPA family protein
MPSKIQRSTAKIVKISDILSAAFIRTEIPNHIILDSGQVSRVNIIGTVVSYGDEKSISIDDGSSSIIVMEFDTNMTKKANVGDTIIVIGKIKEFNSQKYIAPEIIKKIDFRWLKYRAEELGIKKGKKEAAPDSGREIRQKFADKQLQEPAEKSKAENIVEEEVVDIVERAEDEIVSYIRKNDSGEGVDVDNIIGALKVDEAKVESLLKSGDIFLVKPGKVKVLE